MTKTQETIKLAGTYGKYAGIETMREAKQALHAKDAEIADKQDKLNKLTDHVRHHVMNAGRTKAGLMKDQAELRAIIAKDSGEDRANWAHVYHDNAKRMELITERIVTLAPVLELLTGESPADIIETK